MLYPWPIYAKASVRGLLTVRVNADSRSGECRCQSFVFQIQENLKAFESISESLHRPNTSQLMRKGPYRVSRQFCLYRTIGSSPCQEIRFLAQYVETLTLRLYTAVASDKRG